LTFWPARTQSSRLPLRAKNRGQFLQRYIS
jgi:hypothetical protein